MEIRFYINSDCVNSDAVFETKYTIDTDGYILKHLYDQMYVFVDLKKNKIYTRPFLLYSYKLLQIITNSAIKTTLKIRI